MARCQSLPQERCNHTQQPLALTNQPDLQSGFAAPISLSLINLADCLEKLPGRLVDLVVADWLKENRLD